MCTYYGDTIPLSDFNQIELPSSNLNHANCDTSQYNSHHIGSQLEKKSSLLGALLKLGSASGETRASLSLHLSSAFSCSRSGKSQPLRGPPVAMATGNSKLFIAFVVRRRIFISDFSSTDERFSLEIVKTIQIFLKTLMKKFVH